MRAHWRHARYGRLITETLDALVRDELSDPALEDVALTEMELSPDGQLLRAWFVAKDMEAAGGALARSEGFLRVMLSQRLSLKRIPHLFFEPDPRGGGAV
ncbi:MAG: ribosome-binding factor A [Myxococcota bacterium]